MTILRSLATRSLLACWILSGSAGARRASGATPAAPPSSKCAPLCTQYGTCNEELGRCDCPHGRGGDDCSVNVIPNCELIPGYVTPCSDEFETTCACTQDCFASWHGVSAIPGQGRTCWSVNPVEKKFTTVEQLVEMYNGDTEPFDKDFRGQPRPITVAPIGDCPDNCNLHGQCDKQGRCRCFPGWKGPKCEKWESRPCYSDCNGKGTCMNGFCKCEPGFWGTDCSISFGPDGQTAVLWSTKASNSRGPSIYIYDLPPWLDSWYNGYRSVDRPVASFIHERLLSSEYRTPDPRHAAFFFVPFAHRKVGHFADTLPKVLMTYDYIKKTWPAWNASNGHNHLQVLVGDYGAGDFFGMGRYEVLEPLKNVILLTHNGNTLGGRFRPGQDIVLPPLQGRAVGFEPSDSPLWNNRIHFVPRTTVLFFAGTIREDNRPQNLRNIVYQQHRRVPAFEIVPHSVKDYKAKMAASVFCLGVPGTGGDGWGRRTTLGMLYGCVPVIIGDSWRQPLEELLPWDAFSIRVADRDIPKLPYILKAINDTQLESMQRVLKCVAERMLFTTVYGRYGGEDGSKDSIESIVETLRRRLRATDGKLGYINKLVDNPDAEALDTSAVEERIREWNVRMRVDEVCAEGPGRSTDDPEDLPVCEHSHTRTNNLCLTHESTKRGWRAGAGPGRGSVDTTCKMRPVGLYWPPGGAICNRRDVVDKPCAVPRACRPALPATGQVASGGSTAPPM